MIFAGEKKFVREMFSEPDGKGSLARVLIFLVVLCSLVWGSVIVWHEYKMPDFVSVTLLLGTLYGINSLKYVAGQKFDERTKQFLDDLTRASSTPAPPNNQSNQQ